jgi:hypothetical protein
MNREVSDRRGLYSPSEETPEQRREKEEAYDMLAQSLNVADSAAPVVFERPESPGRIR